MGWHHCQVSVLLLSRATIIHLSTLFFRIGDDKANDATVLVVIRKKNENVEEGSVQNRDRKRLAPLMVTVSVWLCLMEH